VVPRAKQWFGLNSPVEELVADLAPDPYGWHMPLAKTTGLRCRQLEESHRGFPGAGSAPGKEQES